MKNNDFFGFVFFFLCLGVGLICWVYPNPTEIELATGCLVCSMLACSSGICFSLGDVKCLQE